MHILQVKVHLYINFLALLFLTKRYAIVICPNNSSDEENNTIAVGLCLL